MEYRLPENTLDCKYYVVWKYPMCYMLRTESSFRSQVYRAFILENSICIYSVQQPGFTVGHPTQVAAGMWFKLSGWQVRISIP